MALRVWLPLTGTLENKGISNITISKDAEVTLNTNGKIGACASCETSGKIITATIPGLGAMLGRGKSYTMCAWIKWLNHGTSGWVAQLATTNPTGFWWTNTSSNPRIVWNENDGGKRCGDNSLATDYTNWHHYAFVITKNADGTSIIAQHYTDGVRSTSYPGTTWNGSSQSLASGDTLKLYPYTASINDFRIYDHALSAAEVHEISQGLVLHYKLDFLPYNFSTNTVTSFTNFTIGQYYYTIFSINMTDFLSSTGAVNGDKFTFSVDINATSNTKRLCARVQHYNSSSDRNSVMGNYIAPGQSGRSSVIFTVNTAYTRLDFLINNGDNGSVTANSTEQYKCTRIEKGEVHSGYFPTGITPYIQDSSGYGHNGTIVNTPSLVNSQARYTSNIHFSANNQHIQLPAITYSNFGNSFTIAWWGRRSTHSNMMFWGFSDGNRLNGMYNGTLWNTGDGSNNPIYKPGTTTTITAPTATSWHHYVMIGNGTKSQLYVDGVLYGEAKTYKGLTGTSIWINGWRNHTEYSSADMDISDFRIYCTVLSADDILSLYHTAAKVDNLGGLHTYEINEHGQNKLKKTGVFYNYVSEPYIQLSDGSYWKLLLFHYVDNGNNLFTSATAAYNDGFGLYSRLRDIDKFKYNNLYEFYVIQDGITHRWSQTNAPLTTTSVTGFTSISGSPSSGICKCNGNTLLARTSTTSNWWNAAGCWTKFSTGGKTGIPGFGTNNAAGMCTEYLALYARIDEITYKTASNNHYANNLIEF